MTLMIELVGIIGNAFFMYLLLRYVKGSTGKTLLLSYHLCTFIYLCSLFFPVLAVASSKTRYTPEQCKAPAVIIQLTGVFQILCLALMAHVRWRIIDCEMRADPGSAPDSKRYIAGLAIFVSLVVVAVQIHGEVVNAPFLFLWHVLLCARLNSAWSVVFYTTFFVTAPYVFFCYRKVIKVIRAMVEGSSAAKEPVRLIYALTICYYITHTPFYFVFTLNQETDVATPIQSYQGWKLLQISFSTMAPILSILLTKKYRRIAHAALTCNAGVFGTSVNSTDGSKVSKSTLDSTAVDVKPTPA